MICPDSVCVYHSFLNWKPPSWTSTPTTHQGGSVLLSPCPQQLLWGPPFLRPLPDRLRLAGLSFPCFRSLSSTPFRLSKPVSTALAMPFKRMLTVFSSWLWNTPSKYLQERRAYFWFRIQAYSPPWVKPQWQNFRLWALLHPWSGSKAEPEANAQLTPPFSH